MAEGGEPKTLAASAKANSDLQSAILGAMADVESSLQNEPEFVGESREAEKRLLIVEPLSVIYKIDHRQRVVHILRASVRRPTS
jgi:glycine cleavage system H lipoate-binding protein